MGSRAAERAEDLHTDDSQRRGSRRLRVRNSTLVPAIAISVVHDSRRTRGLGEEVISSVLVKHYHYHYHYHHHHPPCCYMFVRILRSWVSLVSRKAAYALGYEQYCLQAAHIFAPLGWRVDCRCQINCFPGHPSCSSESSTILDPGSWSTPPRSNLSSAFLSFLRRLL